ncbi:hypothetical protein GCM10010080_09800 [Thermomonas carbonis]|nr:hypothetical protein GCM10010080_09800 [Thermomonas carbonis]
MVAASAVLMLTLSPAMAAPARASDSSRDENRVVRNFMAVSSGWVRSGIAGCDPVNTGCRSRPPHSISA